MEHIDKLMDLFVGWNNALFSHFFPEDLDEEDEVCIYIDRNIIEKIGQQNSLGGYKEFLQIVMLPVNLRKTLYSALRKRYIGTARSKEKDINTIFNSSNLFVFATIFIDNGFYKSIKCPFLIYIAFAILMGSECYHENQKDLGKYITAKLRTTFPRHNDKREGLDDLFDELADCYPQFRAEKLTKHPYVGLIRYQLGLTKPQENTLKKAMYNADISDDVPYIYWAEIIKHYVDDSVRGLLEKSKKDTVLRRRISDLRVAFDPSVYELNHEEKEIQSKGKFVLAVYEDDYTAENDRLVLLTDVNNKTITSGQLRIEKGTIDRLGEYAEYNINHVLIGNGDKAEMRRYIINSDEDSISSGTLGNIVTFSRCNSNYLIQTIYPHRGNETYILVKHNHEDEWQQWQEQRGNPCVTRETNEGRVRQIFGTNWDMYLSTDIEYVGRENNNLSTADSIVMDGGIRFKGKLYLITALPCFEFPEPINLDNLEITINIDDEHIEENNYTYKIVDQNKLVIDLIGVEADNHAKRVKIELKYTREDQHRLEFQENKYTREDQHRLKFQENFSIIGQDVKYKEEDLFKINMWGDLATDDNSPYLKGTKIYKGSCKVMPNGTGIYQNNVVELNVQDRCFYLVNLITAVCCTKEGFAITENQLKKCIRYAATRFDVNISSDTNFYTKIKYLLINSGYINVDLEHNKYQPVPPTFLKTAIGIDPNQNLFMLLGSYTQKFLSDLKAYCNDENIGIYLHTINNEDSRVEDLLPPVILLGHNFDPNKFEEWTNSQFFYYGNNDIAINILGSVPSMNDYDNTLTYVSNDVFNTNLLPANSDEFPRVRKSRVSGYGASTWIEKNENEFYRVAIRDKAWAEIYCRYRRQVPVCIKEYSKLRFPAYLHLPVMMQRALYILNFGIPKKEKVFICNNEDSNQVYYNVIKRYDIKDTANHDEMSSIEHVLTENGNANVIRDFNNCSRYKIFLWSNQSRQSRHPRSLLVLCDVYGRNIYSIGIKKSNFFEVYLRGDINDPQLRRIDKDDVNSVFSRILNTRFVNSRLEYTLESSERTFKDLGVRIVENETMVIPPRKEYEIEEITII